MTPDRLKLVVLLLMGILMLVCGAAILLLREAARRDMEARVDAVIGGGGGGIAEGTRLSFRDSFAGMLRSLGDRVRAGTKLYSDDDLAALEGVIIAAGLNPRRVLPMVLGGKIVMMVAVPLLAYGYGIVAGVSPLIRVAAVIFALPIGLLTPDWIVGAIRRPYMKALRKGVADALDLLVVCTEAGMGLETALERVAQEIRLSNPAMSSALGTLLDELKVLPNRREALINFGKRSGVDGIRRMSTMLAQTLDYGTPLGQALRNVAGELRRERVTRLEERAVRLPVLLIFPMIFFIMPSMFIVMGGVPFLGLIDMLTKMSGG